MRNNSSNNIYHWTFNELCIVNNIKLKLKCQYKYEEPGLLYIDLNLSESSTNTNSAVTVQLTPTAVLTYLNHLKLVPYPPQNVLWNLIVVVVILRRWRVGINLVKSILLDILLEVWLLYSNCDYLMTRWKCA